MNHEEVELIASVSTGVIVSVLIIFVACYAIIISEKIHRTAVALIGASLMIMLGVAFSFYTQHEAIAAIDFNTIGLLIGMMIIVEISKTTGLFQYIAIKAAKLAKGNPWKILIFFSIITAVLSAFLDNVTTILLLIPITIVICDNLQIDPKAFIFSEIFMSNIGGTATLIGDPPNILIGSAANLTFLDFFITLGPCVLILILVMIPIFKLFFGKNMITTKELQALIMSLKESETIKDKKLLVKSIIVISSVIVALFFHGSLHLEAATIAIFGAAILLVFDLPRLEHHLSKIEWTTIFFFVGLFILVGGLESVGVINWSAEKLIALTHGNFFSTTIVVLWGSAFLSAFIDNIPFVATMIPIIKDMSPVFDNLNPLWWSLALGACLGGNGTLIGASANLVAAGLAEKSNYKISFIEFLKYGFVVMFVTVAISNVYLILKFF